MLTESARQGRIKQGSTGQREERQVRAGTYEHIMETQNKAEQR